MILLSAVEEAKRLTSGHFYKNYDSYMDQDWARSKSELIQILDVHKSSSIQDGTFHAVSTYKPVPYLHSAIGLKADTTGRRGKSNLDSRMASYSSVVIRLVEAGGDYIPLISEFCKCVERVEEPDSRKREVMNCWDLLKKMVDEPSLERRGVFEVDKYRSLTNGAKEYFEKNYELFIREQLNRISPTSQLGPTDNIELVRRFIECKTKNNNGSYPPEINKEIWQDVPVWALIFYLLRCGFNREAFQVAESSSVSTGGDVVPKDVVSKLQAMAQQSDSDRIQVERSSNTTDHRNNTGHESDYFKEAVYMIIGKYDYKRTIPTAVSKSTDDWIWFRLCLINLGDSQRRLEELQQVITKYGPAHFCRNKNTLLYFKLLLATKQFELAIEYLCGRDIDGYQVEATHFAIAMYRYGLINISDSINDPLLKTASDVMHQKQKILNIQFIIKDYSRLFRHTDQGVAAYYYALFLIKDESIFRTFIHDLIVETGDPTPLLGSLDPSPQKSRRPGFLDKIVTDEIQLSNMMVTAAREYEKRRCSEIAIELYFMSFELHANHFGNESLDAVNDLKSILRITNNELKRVMIHGDSDRDQIISMASNKIKDRFHRDPSIHKSLVKSEYETFEQLCKLTTFFDLIRESKWSKALEMMTSLRIVPLGYGGAPARDFKKLDATIQARISDLMNATMIAIYNEYHESKRRGADRVELDDLREKANAVLAFAGMIQECVSRDVYARLMRMQVLLSE
ncbi:nuclear pore complex protein Nup93 [Acrasis kona]|uniref:Nuclear pore protein n=1 Tax=Acrasis kona TaxID=1008807 RepID=A0AAW2YXB5_9EUKA